MKVYKFAQMMMSLGHTVYLYSSDDNTAPVTEHISVINKEEQEKFFGHTDWKKDFFPIEWDNKLPYWQLMNNRAIAEIGKRIKPRDFIGIIGGICQQPIADAFPNHMSVEYGIGYTGVFSKYRVYESYAHMHYVHGLMRDDNARFFDAVIPNYFDPDDFEYQEKKQDYYLYLGRLIRRKGVEIASDVCKKIGKKLVIAGQGAVEYIPGKRLVTKEFTIEGDHFEYVGTVGIEKRNELMKNAKAVFYPTYYIGPFEGVAVEANFCGTPSIVTDWGAYAETIQHGRNGYRCRTFEQFIWAAKNVDKLSPERIQLYAVNNYSIYRVREMYQEYFDMLYTLWNDGFYHENSERKSLNWLRRF